METTWNFLDYKIEAGEKIQVILNPYNEKYDIPATIVNGKNTGKTVVISGGLHSGEYPGVVATSIAAKNINPEDINGRIIFLHCVNTSGFFKKVESIIPEDGINLNTDFPGDKNGTIGKKIEAFLEEKIISEADFIMDFHSGGGTEPMSPCLFFKSNIEDSIREVSLGAAKAIGIKHLIASTGSTGFIGYSASKGVPGLLVERGSCNDCEKEDYMNYVEDINLLLNYLDVLKLDVEVEKKEKVLWNKTDYIVSEHQGLWYPRIKPGMCVKKDEILGEVKDFFGNVLAEYRAKEDSRIMYHYSGLAINKGTAIAACGRIKDSELLR